MKQVTNYAEFIKANRENIQPEGFDFDVDMFENLIDWWTPKEEMPVLLRTTRYQLDRFCQIVYKMDFDTTYTFLSGLTTAIMRKTFSNLAASGNTTALNLTAEHFMKLKSSQNDKAVNIRIVNDLKDDDEE